MENPEEILQCLEEFSKIKPKDIPRELEEYLCFVAKTGNPVYQWPVIKCLFRQKLINVISEFYETCPAIDIPPCLNVDLFNYSTMKTFILEKLDTFVAAPFTVQRICELLTTPRKQYNRIDKYMRALEKNILVVSTTEPVYRSTENGENNNQAIVNGLESDHLSSASSDDTPNINIEEMDDTPPQSTPSPPWNRPHNTTINTNQPSLQLQEQEQQPAERLLDAASPTVVVVEGVQGHAGVGGGDLVFGGGIEEEGGSSDEDEEEENRLLAGDSEVDKDVDEKLVKIEDQPQSTLSTETIAAKPLEITPSTTIAEPTVETIVQQHEPTSSELLLPTTIAPTIAAAVKKLPADGVVVVEQVSADIVLDSAAALLLVVEGDVGTVGGDAKEEGDRKEEQRIEKTECGESSNMSDMKPESPAETIKKLPSEATDNLIASVETAEIISSEILQPQETLAVEIADDVKETNVNTDSKQIVKTPETSEIIDKETDIVEKHDTSAIVKEAEKLEKEVTEVVVEEKPAEKIEEIVNASADEVANVEQDERMEVDDDTLPNILEATSASL